MEQNKVLVDKMTDAINSAHHAVIQSELSGAYTTSNPHFMGGFTFALLVQYYLDNNKPTQLRG